MTWSPVLFLKNQPLTFSCFCIVLDHRPSMKILEKFKRSSLLVVTANREYKREMWTGNIDLLPAEKK